MDDISMNNLNKGVIKAHQILMSDRVMTSVSIGYVERVLFILNSIIDQQIEDYSVWQNQYRVLREKLNKRIQQSNIG